MSAGPSVFSWAWTLRWRRIVRIWALMAAEDCSTSFGRSGVEMSTAMTTSAPIWRATFTGRLLATPPSTRKRPSLSTGAKTPGMERLARIASARSPDPRTTSSPVTMSDATARKGMLNRSKSRISRTRVSCCLRSRLRFCPWMSPRGTVKRPSRCPRSKSILYFWLSSLRRNAISSTGGVSMKASFQERLVTSFSSSAVERPAA
ncbi:MAG: hypothetical protein A4E73_01232 [Syntrophaceae bacterium PtaU1.Bin231]|nr:MAG: hypothetical protein A4E73_01232 [Syntrophaceae bacterium PtaU1.Bin231]